MIKVEKGKITQTSLPRYGYINSKFVSTMANAPIEALKADGWYEPEHRRPVYDPAYEKLSTPQYTYDSKVNKVYADYTVIEMPEAVLKKRLDELESKMAIAEDKVVILETVLIDKAVLQEADLIEKL